MSQDFMARVVKLLLVVLSTVALVVAGQSMGSASQGTVEAAGTTVLALPVVIGPAGFQATPVGSGFNEVVAVTHAGDGRLFIGERAGRVLVMQPNGLISTFLDIRPRVLSSRGEYGLYDLAFHPGYADPSSPGFGLLYVTYTTGHDFGEDRLVHLLVTRFKVTADPNVADPASEIVLLREKQSFDVHKGGGLAFDTRNNLLYVGVGEDRLLLIAQDLRSPKGKVIRLRVDDVPPNATADQSWILPDEVWVMGLRNPYRIHVDVPSDQLFIGDVGDLRWEEINLAPLGAPYFNFGWPCMEGPDTIPEANDIPQCKNPANFNVAIHQYPHHDGNFRCAVIGGRVYRPDWNPADNRYIFGDMCTREVFSLTPLGATWERKLLGVVEGELLSTFGEDINGNLYAGTLAASGPIYRLTIPAP